MTEESELRKRITAYNLAADILEKRLPGDIDARKLFLDLAAQDIRELTRGQPVLHTMKFNDKELSDLSWIQIEDGSCPFCARVISGIKYMDIKTINDPGSICLSMDTVLAGLKAHIDGLRKKVLDKNNLLQMTIQEKDKTIRELHEQIRVAKENNEDHYHR